MQLNHPILRCRCGFTLLELVLAMGVCAVVLAAISGVFYSSVRLQDSTILAVDEALPVWQTLAIIRRDLQGAMHPSLRGVLAGDFKVGDVPSPGMSQNVAIELYTTTGALHDTEPWGDVQRVTYEVRPTTTGKALIRSVTRNLLTAITPEPEERRLMGNVVSVNFDCYDGTQWRADWDTTLSDTNLPLAVRINIQVANDFQSVQPIILVVPLDTLSPTNHFQSATNS